MSDLKPCPWCDSEGKVMRVRIGTIDCWHPFANHASWCPIANMEHDGVTAYVTREHAIEAWNRRVNDGE